MKESETGEWVTYDEFEALIEQHDDALFGVIEERNEEISRLQETHKTLGDDTIKANCANNELNEEISRLQETHKTLGDDTIKANCVNNELYAMLIISSILNFIAMVGITLFMLGKI